MPNTVTILPDQQRDVLLQRYAATVSRRRNVSIVVLAVLAALTLLAAVMAEVRPQTFFANIGNFGGFLAKILPPLSLSDLPGGLAEWYWGLGKWLGLLGDTILTAYLGTLSGAIFAFLLCFLATSNLVQTNWLRFCAKRLLEFCRTVPDLVFALIFVIAFGLGPMAGVFALAIHTTGALGKLFAEVVENIDMKPVEGVSSTGAPWHVAMRYGALPQVMSNFVSYTLLRFEINVRESAVMGFVGAGGIGQDLIEAIRKFYYTDVSAILLLILVTVAIIDTLTSRVRHQLIGREERR